MPAAEMHLCDPPESVALYDRVDTFGRLGFRLLFRCAGDQSRPRLLSDDPVNRQTVLRLEGLNRLLGFGSELTVNNGSDLLLHDLHRCAAGAFFQHGKRHVARGRRCVVGDLRCLCDRCRFVADIREFASPAINL